MTYDFRLPGLLKKKSSLQSIFITRPLASSSSFLNKLAGYPFEIEGYSLIQFSPVLFSVVPVTDWIFFYSRHAVTFFFRRVNELELEIRERTKWAAIGPATAKALKTYVSSIDFTGDGNPVSTAKQFKEVGNGQTVLFPRAQSSRQSIQKLLARNIQAMDLIVYVNEMDSGKACPEADILVFTSPLNAKAYFEKRKPKKNQGIVAIGNTTAATLKKLGIKSIFIANEPSEEALAKTIIENFL